MIGWIIFHILVFPGLLFTSVCGLLVGWYDRKLSAAFQFRKGPPLLQNFNDFFKLLGKETIVVKDAVKSLYISAPIMAFAILVMISTIIGLALFYQQGFGADLFVVMYLTMTYSVMVVLSGAATGNVYGSIGAGREIKLLLADELAFILVFLVAIVKAGYQLRFDEIFAAQQASGPFLSSPSGIIAFIVGLLCIQAKMTLPPFHIPEAETEIVDGPFMEYSGPLLGFWKLNHYMMYVTFPFLLIFLFWGGFQLQGIAILWFFLKYLLIVTVMIIIKNTNPRIRIDTALNFFWKYAAPLAFIAVILAVLGV